MKIIIGLGNPGAKYQNNRHNIGYYLLDNLVRKLNLEWTIEPKFSSTIARQGDVIFAKPTTFMNNSGEAVIKLLNFYKIDTMDLVVIHDDVDLEFGKIKVSVDASSGGHHGVADIIEKLGTQSFKRLRIGIGRPLNSKFDVANYVLDDFTPVEFDLLEKLNIFDLLMS